MKRTQASKEGLLIIDHRAGEGMTSNPLPGGLIAPSGRLVESATVTCSHCQAIVVLNPDRSRARHYCPKCDNYICDGCEAVRVMSGGACLTFNEIIDKVQESALKQGA